MPDSHIVQKDNSEIMFIFLAGVSLDNACAGRALSVSLSRVVGFHTSFLFILPCVNQAHGWAAGECCVNWLFLLGSVRGRGPLGGGHCLAWLEGGQAVALRYHCW